MKCRAVHALQYAALKYSIVSRATLPIPESEVFAHDHAGVEGLHAEIDGAVDVPQVGELDPGVWGQSDLRIVGFFGLRV